MQLIARTLLLALSALPLSLVASAQGAAQSEERELTTQLKARSIGPAGMSGRVAAIEALVSDPRTIYVGAATGGLWRTRNSGMSWENLMTEAPVASIGAIAVNQRRPDIIWIGTGEGNPRNSAAGGKGIWRSIDGGHSFEHLGLDGTEKIHRVLLHPSDPNIAYVAAVGTSWGESEERGVYRTRDGGANWERVLFVDQRTGCADLAQDPSNPDHMIAAMWDHRRQAHFFRSGGPGSGLHRTLDGGDTWEKIEEGMPAGELGRIGLAFSASHPDTVYALVEAENSALLRSSDGGFTWESVNTDTNIASRAFYYADIRVDPKDPRRVYSLGSVITVSEDAGASFQTLVPWSLVHPDHHALWIHPENPDLLINGNDGGVAISRDRGQSWRFVRNLPLAQFYHLAVDQEQPYNIYGGMQDNGSWRGPSAVWENGGIRNHHWSEVGFGDGFATLPMADDPTRGYAMSQGGLLMRWRLDTGGRKVIRPDGPTGDEVKLRFNWNAGIALDPLDPSGVFYGSQFVHYSSDRGDSWQIISPDLTTDNKEWQRQAESGGLTLDVTDAENYCSILTIAPSTLDPKVIWVGTDDGRMHITRDRGESWTSVENNWIGVPENTWIPHIEASKHDPAVAYAVFDDHYRANWTPYVYRTSDYGSSWSSLATEELDGYLHVIEEDPIDPQLLFLGTEFGLCFSRDGGRSWEKWTEGVPTVSVRALVVHSREHDLIVGTHGRAAFVIDDISSLRSFNDARELDLHVYPARDTYLYNRKQTGESRFPASEEYRGENVAYGAAITFWLDRDQAEADWKLEKLREAKEERENKGQPAVDRLEGLDYTDSADDGSEEEHEFLDDVKSVTEALEEMAGRGLPDSAHDESEEAAPAEKKATSETGEEAELEPYPIKAEVEIRMEGNLIRSFEVDAEHGLNRFMWNLRQKGYRSIGFDPQSKEEPGGNAVLPGTYNVQIRSGHLAESRDVVVHADPREQISMEDRLAKHKALERLGRAREEAALKVLSIQRLRKDIEHIIEKANESKDPQADDGDHPLAELVKSGEKLLEELKACEELFHTPGPTKGITADNSANSELGTAGWYLGSSREKPTRTQMKQLEQGERRLQQAKSKHSEVVDAPLQAFRKLTKDSGIGLLSAAPQPLPR